MAFYILVKPTFGKFGPWRTQLSDILVEAGSLWQEVSNVDMQRAIFNQFTQIGDQENSKAYDSIEERYLYVIGGSDEVKPLPPKWSEMLLAVKDYKERLRLFHDEHRLYWASRLSIGDVVYVDLANGKTVRGHLRWIGPGSPQRNGTLFGVEVPRSLGVTDGTFNGVRLFTTPPSSALFVSVSVLRFSPSAPPPIASSSPTTSFAAAGHGTNWQDVTALSRENNQCSTHAGQRNGRRSSWLIDLRSTRSLISPPASPLNGITISRNECSTLNDNTIVGSSPAASALPPLTVGERVVYLQDGDAQYGTVRWIGRISGFPSKMAGVDFDNPIGSGSGYYNGTQLFKTRLDHASIIPLEGLIRAVDYDKDETEYKSLKKDLLVDFDAANETSIWTTGQQENTSGSPSPQLIDTSGEDLESRVEEFLALNTEPIKPGVHVEVLLHVNITTPALAYYGIVRWMGKLPWEEQIMVGVELDKPLAYWIRCATDGVYRGERYFTCGPRRGVFVPLTDVRVQAAQRHEEEQGRQRRVYDESIPQFPAPWKSYDIHILAGKPKGIQGKSNSCYMDATLFALFTASDAFDDVLFHAKRRTDIQLYDEIRTCLKTSIVSPLRWRGYVEGEAVMKLRRLVGHALPETHGWTTDEKDPEELINALFGDVFKVPPDIHLTTGESAHICQLVIEDTFQKSSLTSVQTLLERSFFCSNVMLKSVPQRFIVQLPRYGKQKLYDFIVPTLKLDLSNVVANRYRQCGTCGQAAQWQCKECYLIETNEYARTFYCNICFGKFHSNLRRNNDHQPTNVVRPMSPAISESPYLELSAVVCIESSHYVAFARMRDTESPRWVFFDSMADREGGDVTGHNLPEVIECDEYFDHLLRAEYREHLVDALPLLVDGHATHNRTSDPKPDHMERLLKDCYICIYVRPSP